MANIKGKSGSSVRFYFLGLQNSADSDCGAEIKIFAPWKESYDKPRQCIKKQRHDFANKVMVFLVVMCRSESWAIKKCEHPRTDAFELWCWRRLFESSLGCKKIKLVNPKGNQP